MKLSNAEIIKLLPQFMRDDPAVQGLAMGIDPYIRELAARAELLKTWNQIDAMNEQQLDELAWELNIEWYFSNADIETKRLLIKEADLVHARLGTKWAVEAVISAYFGEGVVQEWFEYGGDPHHFQVVSTNPAITQEALEQFMYLLELVKRKSSWLDRIIIILPWKNPVFTGFAYHELTREVHRMGGNL